VVEVGLAGGGEQVQHRVRRPAHRDVERHGVVNAPRVAMPRGGTVASSWPSSGG
jgi:hypothetical protein